VVLVFGLGVFGCGGGGSDDDDGDKGKKVTNPIVDRAKFFKITKRTNDYFTLDIKAGKDGNDAFTANKKHTITVYGNAKSGSNCTFSKTDDPWSEQGDRIKSGDDGMFTIEREFSVAELTDTAQNIRIKIAETIDFEIYEITIVDEDGTAVFTMSTDEEIQALASGDYFTTDDEDTAWLRRAGTPKITVMVPGEEAGEEEGEGEGEGEGEDSGVVWQPTITATTTMNDDGQYIGNTGIQRGSAAGDITLTPIDGGFTIEILDGNYKQVNMQCPNAGGTNYYTSAGFTACATGTDYTISFNAFVDTGTGTIRAQEAGGTFTNMTPGTLGTSPTLQSYSWTQGSGNFKIDTGDTATGTTITITGIKITTP
jgi:hypothetical protein